MEKGENKGVIFFFFGERKRDWLIIKMKRNY